MLLMLERQHDLLATAQSDTQLTKPDSYEGHFAHPEIRGLKTGVLNIVTDQNAAFGQFGDVFQYNLTAMVVPTPSSLTLGLVGATLFLGVRRGFGRRKS
jgi:hypothetical protein